MTTSRGPLVRLHLCARRTIMPTILHDNNADQQAAEQTSREISRNVATALRAAGVTQRRGDPQRYSPHRFEPTPHGRVAAALPRTIRTSAGAGHHNADILRTTGANAP